jgi:hypothetical protein
MHVVELDMVSSAVVLDQRCMRCEAHVCQRRGHRGAPAAQSTVPLWTQHDCCRLISLTSSDIRWYTIAESVCKGDQYPATRQITVMADLAEHA